MSIERTREFLLTLPRTEETLQWENLVYWVLDKAVGGKMFAMVEPEPGGAHVAGFAVPPDQFLELLEIEGVRPAPYLARAHWVVVERWDVFTAREWQQHLQAAYDRVEAKLPTRVQRLIELKDREYRSLVREKRTAAKAATKRSRGTHISILRCGHPCVYEDLWEQNRQPS
jgi:predicted DNA-binding protein (MmcQ/YjbR family)